jgi:hypothetical protein
LPPKQGFVTIFNSEKVHAYLEKKVKRQLLRNVVQNVALRWLKEGTIKNSAAVTVAKFFILLLLHVVLKQRIWIGTIFELFEAFFSSGFLREFVFFVTITFI